MHKKLYSSFFLLLLIVFISGCTNPNEPPNEKNEQLEVFTTVFPLQYFTEQIGGEHVNVTSIYPPGTDEHTFEPSQKEMMRLSDADLFIYIGLGLEGFVEKAKNVLQNADVTLIPAGEAIKLEGNSIHAHPEDEEGHHADGHTHGDIDPHVWLDPLYSKELAQQVLHGLVEQKPELEPFFTDNYEALEEKLMELDTQFNDVVNNSKRKQIVVAHAAYGYWEQRYGITQIPIAGLSTTDEPSQKKLKEVIDLIRKKDIPYILNEQNVTSKIADVIRKETETEELTIHNLAVLTEDDVTQNEDYFSLMEQNIEVLQKALND